MRRAPSSPSALTLALTALLLAGCGDGGSSADDETSTGDRGGNDRSVEDPGTGDGAGDTGSGVSELTGRTFLAQGVTQGGQPKPLVEGTELRVEFTDDGRVVVNAGCNTMSGTVTVDGDGLDTGGGLATTQIGCEPALHEQDTWVGELFTANPTYALDGDRLTLTAADTTVELLDRQTADPDRPLQDTVWQLDGIVDADAVSSVPGEVPATLTIRDGTIEIADTGCNGGGGEAEITDTEITVDGLIWTMMACGEPSTTIERAFGEVLEGTISYEIEADVLTLSHPSGKGLTLRAR